MIKKTLSILCLVYATLFSSCHTNFYTTLPNDNAIEELFANDVDSLSVLLEDEITLSTLSDEERAKYGFWITRMHDKQGRSLVNDSLIHLSIPYFKETNSVHLTTALRLAAKQMNWSGNSPEKGCDLLKEALSVAIAQNDTSEMQHIYEGLSLTYRDMDEHLKAIETLHALADISSEAFNINISTALMLEYVSLGVLDSALHCAKQAATQSRKMKSSREYDRTRTYAELLNVTNQSEKALLLLKDLSNRFPERKGDVILVNYITTWFNLGKIDSAKVYMNRLESLIYAARKDRRKDSEEIKAQLEEEINTMLFVIKASQLAYNSKKQLPVTLLDIGLHADNEMKRNRNRSHVDRELQFAQNKLRNDNLKLDVEKSELSRGLLFLSVLALLLVTVLVYFYQRKLLKKERTTQKNKKQLHLNLMRLNENESVIRQNESIINTLKSQLDESDELKESVQKQLFEIEMLSAEIGELNKHNGTLRLEIDQSSQILQQKDQELISYEKMAEQNATLQDRERFLTAQLIDHIAVLNQLRKNPHYIDDLQWHEITHAVNLLYDNFTYRLHTDYPLLTEEDLRCCCLFKLQLPIPVIAILTAISPASVTKRKQRIKEKMGRQKSSENIKEQPLEAYLWRY